MNAEQELYFFLKDVCGIGSGRIVKNPESLYKELCLWLDGFWNDNGKLFCWGCHRSLPIEHHHIVTRRDINNIGKPWLLIDPANIIPLCYDCHHNKLHDGGLEKFLTLKCVDIILDQLEKEYPEKYHRLKFKIEEFKNK